MNKKNLRWGLYAILIILLESSCISNTSNQENEGILTKKNYPYVKEPTVSVSLSSIGVVFNNNTGEGVSIYNSLLLAENYIIENKIDFPIHESKVSIAIFYEEKLCIEVYYIKDWKMLTIRINEIGKVAECKISEIGY